MAFEIKGKKTRGKFVKRLNRFMAVVEVNGKEEYVHVPNSGRMKELLVPGREVIVKHAENKNRKSRYDLLMVNHNDIIVAIDSRLPTKIFLDGFYNKRFKEYADYKHVKTEVAYSNSRFDICLTSADNTKCFLELKSVTLVDKGTGLFPDAPTLRGTRHIEELLKAKDGGFEAGIMFVVLRNDAVSFAPNEEADPLFSEILKKAYERGILITAYICNITPDLIDIYKQIPVVLSHSFVHR